jgi:hypothetical protein
MEWADSAGTCAEQVSAHLSTYKDSHWPNLLLQLKFKFYTQSSNDRRTARWKLTFRMDEYPQTEIFKLFFSFLAKLFFSLRPERTSGFQPKARKNLRLSAWGLKLEERQNFSLRPGRNSLASNLKLISLELAGHQVVIVIFEGYLFSKCLSIWGNNQTVLSLVMKRIVSWFYNRHWHKPEFVDHMG